MAKQVLSTAQLIVNNSPQPIVPNTLSFTEGFGEYTVRASSAGAGRTETIFSENAELKKSKLMFELFPTEDNIKVLRAWKANRNANLFEIPDIGRSFTNASVINDYEVNVGADTTISVEIESDPAS